MRTEKVEFKDEDKVSRSEREEVRETREHNIVTQAETKHELH